MVEQAVRHAAQDVHFAAQLGKQFGTEHRAGAVVAIEHDFQPAVANGEHVHQVEYPLQMDDAQILLPFHRAQLVPSGQTELSGDDAFQKRFPQVVIEHGAGGGERLEAVPLDGIMARRDLQAAGGIQMIHQHAAGGSGSDPRINDSAATGQQPRQDGMLDHRPGGTPVPREDHLPAFKHRAQSHRELRNITRIQPIANHAPEPGDAQNPLRHSIVLHCERHGASRRSSNIEFYIEKTGSWRPMALTLCDA